VLHNDHSGTVAPALCQLADKHEPFRASSFFTQHVVEQAVYLGIDRVAEDEREARVGLLARIHGLRGSALVAAEGCEVDGGKVEAEGRPVVEAFVCAAPGGGCAFGQRGGARVEVCLDCGDDLEARGDVFGEVEVEDSPCPTWTSALAF
jgi:hypothetical protein